MGDYAESRERLLGLLTSLGEIDIENNNYEQAIKRYEKILELGVEEPSIYSQLSKAYLKLERFDTRALNIYKKTLRYQPRDRVLSLSLAEFYLRSNRTDPDAIEAYRHALKFQSPFLKPIALRLIKYHIDKSEVNNAKEIAIQTIHHPEIATVTLTFFLQLFWKEKKYDEVQHILKQSFKATKKHIYLKALCLTYIEKNHKHIKQYQSLNFTEEDSAHCHQYLRQTKNFNTYEDLQISLDIITLTLRFHQSDSGRKSRNVEEYEFFLSGGSPNKILAQGFSGMISANEWHFTFFKLIWNKLKPFADHTRTNSQTEGSIKISEAISANICLIFKIINYKTLNGYDGNKSKAIRESLFENIADIFQAEGTFHIKQLYDGLFVLGNDILPACQAAIKLLRHIEKMNKSKQKHEQFIVSISIWRFNNLHEENLPEAFQEVSCAIKITDLNRKYFSENHFEKQSNLFEQNRLIISEAINSRVKQDDAIITHYIGNVRVPFFPGDYQLYEIEWKDPLDRLHNRTLQKLGRFEILEQLTGCDNYSVVKGRDTLLERLVVIKTIQKEILQKQSDTAPVCEQFLEEAREVSKLNHRNIVVIYDVGEDAGFLYLAREYFEGIDLKKYLQQDDMKMNKRIVKIFLQVCSALKYAHKNGMLHLNMKPTNIIVSAKEETKLTDFGCLNHRIKQRFAKNKARQDLAYMSPEQILQKSVDARSDIFSLGVVLYEALVGFNPFSDIGSIANNIIHKPVRSPSQVDAALPGVFDRIIDKTLAKQPENRYQTIHEIMVDLHSNLKENAMELHV